MEMRIAVVICSVGRPQIVADLLPWISRQTLPPSEVLLVVTKEADLPDRALLQAVPNCSVVFSEKGLPKQRNRGLDTVQARSDAVFFIDDDYLPASDALEGIARALKVFPEAAGFTGKLLADGIHTGGVSLQEAGDFLEAYENTQGGAPSQPTTIKKDLVGLYGCNMAYRCAMIGENRFDERLPLYAWQEDVDFASRLPGPKIKTDAFAGVHCGTSSGRETSGHLLGYSQVANPVYLMKKGSLPLGFGLKLVFRNVVANHLKSFSPESWIDRKGRARGNRKAIAEALRGTSAPERILEIARD